MSSPLTDDPRISLAARYVLLLVCLLALLGTPSGLGSPTSSPAPLPHGGHSAVDQGARSSALSPAPAASWGGPGHWTLQTNYGAPAITNGMTILGNSCVFNETYLTCVGGQNLAGTDISDVFYTNLTSVDSNATTYVTNSTVTTWYETTDYGASSGSSGSGGIGTEWPSCVYYQGYVYCVAGALSTAPWTTSKTFYAPLQPHGGVGAWTETTDFGAKSTSDHSGNRGIPSFQLQCVENGGYIYCLGLGNSSTWYAQLSASGIGAWAESTDYGAATGSTGTGGFAISSTNCLENGTYMFCFGGEGAGYVTTSRVYYAPLSSTGIGAWTETTDLGAASGTSGSGGTPLFSTACFSNGQLTTYVTCIGGSKQNGWTVDYQYYAPISATGGLGAWVNDTNLFGERPLVAHLPRQGVDTYNDDCLDALFFYVNYAICLGQLSNAVYGSPLADVGTITTTLNVTSAAPGAIVHDTVSFNPESWFYGGDVTFYAFDYSPDCGGAPLTLGTYLVSLVNPTPSSNSYTIPAKASGKFSFMAVFYGDDDEEPIASACEVLDITGNAFSPTISTALSATSASVGQSVTDTATIASGDPSGFTGSVIYYYTLGSCPGAGTQYSLKTVTGANGAQPTSSPWTIPTGATGTVYLWATYTGDLNDASAQSACEPLTIVPITPVSTTLTTQLNTTSVYPGGEIHDTATLSTTASSISGSITYEYLGTDCPGGTPSDIGTATVTAAGQQSPSNTVTVQETAGATVYFQATYSGDAYNLASTSACEAVTVEEAPPAFHPSIFTTLSATSAEAGSTQVYDTSTLSGGSTNPAPTGTVTYTYYSDATCSGSGTQIGSAVTLGAGGSIPNSADFLIPSEASGTVCFTAYYSGDSQNAPATSEPETLSVTPAPGGGSGGSGSGNEFHEGPFVGSTGEGEFIGLLGLVVVAIIFFGIWARRRRGADAAPATTSQTKEDQDVDDDETDTPPSPPKDVDADDDDTDTPPSSGGPKPEQLATEENAQPSPPEPEGETPSPPSEPTEQVM